MSFLLQLQQLLCQHQLFQRQRINVVIVLVSLVINVLISALSTVNAILFEFYRLMFSIALRTNEYIMQEIIKLFLF